MAERLHPGVYVEETSSGIRPIEGVSTSTGAFVGVAARGVPGLPTLVTSFDEYRNSFGGHLPKERGFLPMAVAGFFDNGGTRLYVSRAMPANATAAQQEEAQPTRFSPATGTPAPALQFYAKGKGRWAEALRVEIDDASNFPDVAFRVNVVWSENGVSRTLETYDDLRMSPDSDDYFAELINERSRYVTVVDAFALANDENEGTIVPVPAEVPALRARTLATNDSYEVHEGATLEFTWTDSAGGEPRTSSVNFEGGGLTFTDGTASLTSVQFGSFLRDAFLNGDGSRDFRVVEPTLPTPGQIVIDAPAVGTQDLSGETLNVTIGGNVIDIDLEASPAIADTTLVSQGELVAALTAALSPPNQVQASGDQIIIDTEADAVGSTPALAQTPGTNSLTIASVQAGEAAGAESSVTVQPNIATRGRIAIAANAGQNIDLSGETLQVSIAGNQIDIDVDADAVDSSAVSPTALAEILERRLGPGSLVDIVGDEIIVRTQADANGAAPALTVAPNADSLTATASAGSAGTVIESLDGITITVSEAPNRYFPRTLRDAGFPARAQGYEQNAPANPLVRPISTTDAIRLVGGSDGSGDPSLSDYQTALQAFDRTDINIVAMPGKNSAGFVSALLTYCDRRGDCFAVIDGPGHVDDDLSVGPSDAKAFIEGLPNLSKNAAMYYPWPQKSDPQGAGRNPKRFVPPCGDVAGIFARTDVQRGVWKAPAGIEASVAGAIGLQYDVIDAEQDLLNPVGLNCIRQFSGTGIVSWGSRTMSPDPEWRYVPVRRTALFLKESLRRGLQWTVFEPNDEELWGRIRNNIDAFMLSLFRQGAFQGATPDEAYLVLCDRTTNPQELVDQGIVTARVAFAPLKPAEFVVIELSQKTLVAG